MSEIERGRLFSRMMAMTCCLNLSLFLWHIFISPIGLVHSLFGDVIEAVERYFFFWL